MATSGSINFTVTRDQIIKAALRKLGVLSRGTDPDPEDISEGSEALNLMVKAWMAQGIHLWKMQEVTLFPLVGTQSFNFTNETSGANATTSFSETSLSSAASSTDTTIVVTDASAISDGDFILVALDSGDWHSTTVNGSPVGNNVTIASQMPGDAAAGAAVITFTKKINRPLRIVDMRRRIGGQDTDILMVSREEYFQLPNKDSKGTPNQAYYDPQLGTGTLYLWPTATDNTIRIIFTAVTAIEDYDIASNTSDFPQEWEETIVYNLAVRLAHEYSVTGQRLVELKTIADEMLDNLKGWDQEPVSVYFQPSPHPY